MERDVQVSVVQHEPGGMEARPQNVAFIVDSLRRLAGLGSQLAVFPEVGITSFFRHAPGGLKAYWDGGTIAVDGPELGAIAEAARGCGIHAVVGFAERSEIAGMIFNSAALVGPEGVIGVTRKLHMPGIEKLYYTPGEHVEAFDCALGRIGIAICYDAMFPEYFKALSDQGVDIIAITSSTWAGGAKGGVGLQSAKRDYWNALPMVTAIQNQAFVVACNACGRLDMGPQAGVWERLGLSQIVAPTGEILERAGPNEAETLTATLATADLVAARTSYRFLTDRLL
ncbi:carbon-nitrogen hydrolase family protein [Spiribacter halobius]|uniref:CN hydrolase domain-containing protein n=1 Tax=Sediminicurvatus halobius TaxID=2182432 RepID=A0A2U2N9P2_9GAMM|nr:carbon-nitrogen hydrolase family protein [Spiribacter halobius]PWG65790.1 hypothetical protein DEM34_00560 [Spiribacter halobius]UEX77832.1 carbon-nitrogen hydrolase family protein [Spiribacter halobius]